MGFFFKSTVKKCVMFCFCTVNVRCQSTIMSGTVSTSKVNVTLTLGVQQYIKFFMKKSIKRKLVCHFPSNVFCAYCLTGCCPNCWPHSNSPLKRVFASYCKEKTKGIHHLLKTEEDIHYILLCTIHCSTIWFHLSTSLNLYHLLVFEKFQCDLFTNVGEKKRKEYAVINIILVFNFTFCYKDGNTYILDKAEKFKWYWGSNSQLFD